jgi:hypothetical protein
VNELPFLIDGARVIASAPLPDPGGARTQIVANGVPLDAATSAVVVETLADDKTFLLYCNADGETLAAEPHADAAAAQRSAGAIFPSLAWQPYRALTADEEAEVRTTRDFLRNLERDFPGGP